jgi:hypothetical protein
MSRTKKPSEERLRIALAKGKELARRSLDIDKCLNTEQKVALCVALTSDYAALFEEYPDVFQTPPKSPEELRREAKELAESQEATERDEAEAEEASREARAAMNVMTAPRKKPGPPN